MDFSRDNTPLHKMTRGQRMRAIYGADWREKVGDGLPEQREPGKTALKEEWWGEVRGPDGQLKFRHHGGGHTIQAAMHYEVAEFFGSLASGQTTDVDEISYYDFFDDDDPPADWIGADTAVTLNAGADLSLKYIEVIGTYTADQSRTLGDARVYSEGDVIYAEIDFGESTVALATDDTYTYTWRCAFATTTSEGGMTIYDIFDKALPYPFAPGQGTALSPMLWYTDFKDGSWGNEVICTLASGGTGSEDNATVAATYTATASVTITDVRLQYGGQTYKFVDLSANDGDVSRTSGQTFTAQWKLTVANAA